MTTLHDLLVDRILGVMTEQELADNYTSADELQTMSDIDLFELYEDYIFSQLL
jgi:hypothetical protein